MAAFRCPPCFLAWLRFGAKFENRHVIVKKYFVVIVIIMYVFVFTFNNLINMSLAYCNIELLTEIY